MFLAVFSPSHCAGHHFWAVHDADHPRHDPATAGVLGDPIVDVYEAQDAALGRLLDVVGRRHARDGAPQPRDGAPLRRHVPPRPDAPANREGVLDLAIGADAAGSPPGRGPTTNRRRGREPGSFMWYVDGGRRSSRFPTTTYAARYASTFVVGSPPGRSHRAGSSIRSATCSRASWRLGRTSRPVNRLSNAWCASRPATTVRLGTVCPTCSSNGTAAHRFAASVRRTTGESIRSTRGSVRAITSPAVFLSPRGPGIQPGRRADAISMIDARADDRGGSRGRPPGRRRDHPVRPHRVSDACVARADTRGRSSLAVCLSIRRGRGGGRRACTRRWRQRARMR